MKTQTQTVDKVKFTAKDVVDEAIGAGSAALGIVGGSFAMQQVKAKLNLNPWLVSSGAFLVGFGGRVACKMIADKGVREVLKDVSTGIMTAGALDGAKQVVNTLFPAPEAGTIAARVKQAVPTLSGPQPVLSVSSRLLNGPASQVPRNSRLLN